MQIVSLVEKIAKAKHATPSQIAIAWILHKNPHFVPIPGTKQRKYLEENLAASSIQLSEKEMLELDQSLPPVRGPRYAPVQMAWVNR